MKEYGTELLRAPTSGVNEPNDEPGEQKQALHLCRHRQYAAPSTFCVCNFCKEPSAAALTCTLEHAHEGDGGRGISLGIWKRGSIEGGKRRSFDNAGVSEVPLREEGGEQGLYEMEGKKGDKVAMCIEEEEEDGCHK